MVELDSESIIFETVGMDAIIDLYSVSVNFIVSFQTAFANSYRDLLRVPLCPSCSTESSPLASADTRIRAGQGAASLQRPPYNSTSSPRDALVTIGSSSVSNCQPSSGDMSLFHSQIESWKSCAKENYEFQSSLPSSYSQMHQSSSFPPTDGSLGCIACCGALRCIV